MSASSNTSTGEWPPSSIVPRFMCAPASAASCLPTGTEPVKRDLAHDGRADQVVGDLGGLAPDDVQAALGQSSASWNMRAMAMTALGESSGPLSTMRAARAQGGRDLADGLVVEGSSRA